MAHRVDFPFVLDLRPLLTDEQASEWGEDGCSYRLTAVLVHSGSGVHSGHYFARIRVPDNGRWYKFDDESVTPCNIKGGKFYNSPDAFSPIRLSPGLFTAHATRVHFRIPHTIYYCTWG